MKRWIVSLTVVMLTGCAGLQPGGIEPFAFPEPPVAGEKAVPQQSQAQVAPTEAHSRPQPQLYPGTGQIVKLPAPPAPNPVLQQGEGVVLNFEAAPLNDVLRALLGDVLKLDYTIDQPNDVVVTLRTQRALPRPQVLDVVETLLQSHGMTLVRDRAGVYHVTTLDASKESLPAVRGSDRARLEGAGLLIVPLRHIGVGDISRILQPLLPEGGLVKADPVRNLLILRGNKAQLDAWMDIIESFDVDYLAGMSVGIFPLQYASVEEVNKAVAMLLGQQADGTSAEGASAAGPLNGLINVLPIERLNALLVVTPQARYLERIRTWIERLDRPADNEIEPQLFVYPVQNSSASHLAELLNGLFAGEGGRAVTKTSGVAPGLATTQGGSGTSKTPQPLLASGDTGTKGTAGVSQAGLRTAITSGPSGTASSNAGAAVSATLENNVRIVADDRQNALLIRAPRREYRRIVDALRQLDQAPTQVLIEANIVEVTLSGNLKYGLEWYLQNGLGSGFTGSATLNFQQSGSIGPTQPGFSYAITNRAGIIRAVLNAAAERSQLRVLSNPSVLVLDNHTATIQVGQQQPVKSATTVSSNSVTTESITYKDTGVLLTVTPSVNAGELITLDIVQQVTDVGEIDAATGQRQFLTRQIQSRVAVRSGETVVLGGLIRDNDTTGRSGIPGLADLPVVGNLFATNSRARSRTELLVLLTPRALPNESALRAVSDELRQRMRAFQRHVPSEKL
ncbi:MAG: type II secretion system secretin GspD [Hydrogenophilus thermoluteolus]|nr:type II secretion system protein GspD [Rhodocyclaceae bacterium]